MTAMADANILLGIFSLMLVSSSVFCEQHRIKYIQLNHNLIPNNISNIQIISTENEKCTQVWRPEPAKYVKKPSGIIIQNYVKLALERKNNADDHDYYTLDYDPPSNSQINSVPQAGENETEILKKDMETVLGTDVENVFFDEDWGLFSAVLASYNNHWALKTGPEDWWTVVLRNVAQAIADRGDIPKVRERFVDHKGKKEININVGSSLSDLDYSWLFDQFSGAIRDNIKVRSYVDVIESDFSRTTNDQKIISQVMLMSSLKKYFSYGFYTACGIPGVHMKGTQADWAKLIQKLDQLEEILKPVKKVLRLKRWFEKAKTVFANLLKTYNGDREMPTWWSQILSWKEEYGSGAHPHWEGWFPGFLGASSHQPSRADDFPSGLVTVVVNIADNINAPPVKDKGIFVAGTLGFTIKNDAKAPIVEPNQIWNLLLPKGSKVTPRLGPV